MGNLAAKEPFLLRASAGALRLLKRLSNVLPARLVVGIGSVLGSFLFYFFPREHRVMEVQLDHAVRHGAGFNDPKSRSAAGRRAIMQGCFRHAGESLAELLILDRVLARGGVVHSSDEALFRKSYTEGKGALAISAHVGDFELLAASHAKRGVPVTVVGRRPNYPGIAAQLAELRDSYGVQTVWRDDHAGARRLFETLKRGRVLAVLLDQDTDLENKFPPFFGLPAACPVAPIRLAVRLKTHIITTFIVRRGPLEHEVITEDLFYDPADPDAEEKILAEFSRRLERLLQEVPDQWLWWHRRWRREPGINYEEHPELLRGTSAYLEWLKGQTVT